MWLRSPPRDLRVGGDGGAKGGVFGLESPSKVSPLFSTSRLRVLNDLTLRG